MRCGVVFMDESGAGAGKSNKDNFWVSAAVCTKFEDHDKIADSVYETKKKCLRLYNQELKGSSTAKSNLNPGITKEDVAEEIGKIIHKYRLKVWVVSVRYSEKIPVSNFVASNGKTIQAKDVSRELLMERLSEYAKLYGDGRKHQLTWDLSDQQEMYHFSRTISEYIVPRDNKKTG